MKPARSAQETGTLPSFSHSALAVSVTSSAVLTVLTTSTSFMTGAGLKKCIPTTSCERPVSLASEMTGSDEVVVARIAPGLQISSRFSNSTVLTLRSSATASTTRSTSARSSTDVEPVSRDSTWSRAESSSLPRWIALSSDFSIRAWTAATLSSLRPTYVTGKPALANTSTIPGGLVTVPAAPTLAAPDVRHREAGPGEHLDDPGGHGAGADDAGTRDGPALLRLVVRRGRQRI